MKLTIASSAVLTTIMWFGQALADGPPPAPGAPPGRYSALRGAVGIVTYANAFLGAACTETDTITISRFTFVISKYPHDATNNPPLNGPAIVYAEPVDVATLWATISPSFQNCAVATGYAFPRPLAMQFPYLGGQYVTDGTLTLSFGNGIAYPTQPLPAGSRPLPVFATVYARVSGSLQDWKRTSTVTFVRTDLRDPSLMYTAAVSTSFSDNAPRPYVVRK